MSNNFARKIERHNEREMKRRIRLNGYNKPPNLGLLRPEKQVRRIARALARRGGV